MVRRASRVTLVVAVLAAVAAVPAGALTSAAAASAGPALTVDAAAGRHAISSDVYGMNFSDAALATELGLTADRWGGNSTSRYNYTNNTHNTGSDYYFENIVDSTSLDSFVAADLAHHDNPVVTVPAMGWVSKTSPSSHPFDCGFKVSVYGAQQSTDPYDSNCGNGKHTNGTQITGNAASDTSVAENGAFDQAMVAHLVSKFGTAATGGVKSYEIDNEPSLWSSTHVDVHPAPLSYNELWTKSLAAAQGIKAGDPSATVDGPGDWGWCAYFYAPDDPGGCGPGPDKTAHGNLPLAAWYLQQFAAYDKAHGQRLLDYFDEHFYPQETGVSLSTAGSAATQALRLRSTRALWDPTYTDESWTADLGLGPVELIPRMKQWVAQYYPGTKIAISEYNWGGLESINGALAEADVLGIFGAQGVDRAQLWSPPTSSQPGAFAFRMYRNYDGHGSRFGDESVAASSADQGQLSVYAAQRSTDGALTVQVINKTGSDLTSTLAVHNASTSAAQVFTYSAANLNAIVQGTDAQFSAGSVSHTYPANSITLLVIPTDIAVSRLGGANRDATAAAVAHAAFPTAGSAKAVVLARDDVYADGLTGSPLASALGGPLLLTNPTVLSADARSAITHSLAAGGKIYLLGGTSAISASTASTLTGLGYTRRAHRWRRSLRDGQSHRRSDRGHPHRHPHLPGNGVELPGRRVGSRCRGGDHRCGASHRRHCGRGRDCAMGERAPRHDDCRDRRIRGRRRSVGDADRRCGSLRDSREGRRERLACPCRCGDRDRRQLPRRARGCRVRGAFRLGDGAWSRLVRRRWTPTRPATCTQPRPP